ncbi:MAG: 3-dehydroquinate dehydratase / shikimate dehydrogenase [Patescibacteria group bacterium]|nr:3-dehydroquinate dehydratase / shikimate dehydrogenase [Patescibacteria group bacterium]
MFLNTTPHFGVIASINPVHSSKVAAAWPHIDLATSCEIRLDRMEEDDLTRFIYGYLPSLFSNKPMILTLRPSVQGGSRIISPEDQWKFWNSLPDSVRLVIKNPLSNVFVDWAVDLVQYVCDKGYDTPFPWTKIGISDHKLEMTPDDVRSAVKALQEFPASAFIKFVCKAIVKSDVRRMANLYSNYDDTRPLIAFPMGELGKQERFKCIKRGSWGTYGFIPSLSPTAPGQVSIFELLWNKGVIMDLKLRGLVDW